MLFEPRVRLKGADFVGQKCMHVTVFKQLQKYNSNSRLPQCTHENCNKDVIHEQSIFYSFLILTSRR